MPLPQQALANAFVGGAVSATEQLLAIREMLVPMYHRQAHIYNNDVKPSLEAEGIHLLTFDQLTGEEKDHFRADFVDNIMPVLTPLALDTGQRFGHKEISIGLAREALKDLLSIQNRQIGIENIQKTVADFYKIKVADMYSKKRPASIARPRQIAMYLSKEMTQKSLPEIGDLFGGRDHTTVLHAVRKIGGERQKNTELNQQLHVLEQTLKG